MAAKKPHVAVGLKNWLRGLDLNQRPSGYESKENILRKLLILNNHNAIMIFKAVLFFNSHKVKAERTVTS